MRRCCLALGTLLIVATAARGQDAGAESLQREFEKKLTAAKSFQVTFRIETARSANLRIDGQLTIAAGNKVRVTFDGRDGDKPMAGVFVSNGTEAATKAVADGKSEVQKNAARPGAVELLVGYCRRAGIFIAVDSVTGAPPAFTADMVRAVRFKLLDRERLGGRDTQGIQFHLEIPGEPGPLLVKTWFDLKTGLPLKRVVEVSRNRRVELVVTETYADWALDPVLRGNEFDLPK